MTDICALPCLFGLPRADRAVLLSNGHINETYDVHTDKGRFILQSVNTRVFKDIGRLSENTERAVRATDGCDDLCVPQYISVSGSIFVRSDGNVWRMCPYIHSERPTSAYDTGHAFGAFMRRVGMEEPFVCTIDRFHDTRSYYERLRCSGTEPVFLSADDMCFDGIPKRNIHGDAKQDNCIAGEPCAVIDLDTLMTHYAAYDYGDMVRSVCRDGLSGLCDLTAGFARGLGGILSEAEIQSLYKGIICVTGELAMRYMLAAGGREDLGKAPAQCLERAESLVSQLDMFRRNERYIRECIDNYFRK